MVLHGPAMRDSLMNDGLECAHLCGEDTLEVTHMPASISTTLQPGWLQSLLRQESGDSGGWVCGLERRT